MLEPVHLQARIQEPHRRRTRLQGDFHRVAVLAVELRRQTVWKRFQVRIQRRNGLIPGIQMNETSPVARHVDRLQLKFFLLFELLPMPLHPLRQQVDVVAGKTFFIHGFGQHFPDLTHHAVRIVKQNIFFIGTTNVEYGGNFHLLLLNCLTV